MEQHIDDIVIDFDHIEQSSMQLEDEAIVSMEYNCKCCDMTFFSVEDHIRDYHENEEVEVEAEEDVACSYGFEEIVVSSGYHSPANDLSDTTKCNICSTVLKSARSLKMHMRIHDVRTNDTPGNSTESVCSICNRSFDSAEHLQLHLSAHEGITTATEDIAEEQQYREKRPAGYPCQYCGKPFKRPYEKVKHERIHTGEKPYACDLCGKRFRVSSCLTIHKRTHNDTRPYVCPHCKKRFKFQSAYDHHLKIHSNDRGYKCSFCAKSFNTAVQLNGHTKSHTKPFSCAECNRPFGSLYAVRKHMLIHQAPNNKLSYGCDICGAHYGREFALRDHHAQHHGVGSEGNAERYEDDASSKGEIVEANSVTTTVVDEEIIEEELLF